MRPPGAKTRPRLGQSSSPPPPVRPRESNPNRGPTPGSRAWRPPGATLRTPRPARSGYGRFARRGRPDALQRRQQTSWRTTSDARAATRATSSGGASARVPPEDLQHPCNVVAAARPAALGKPRGALTQWGPARERRMVRFEPAQGNTADATGTGHREMQWHQNPGTADVLHGSFVRGQGAANGAAGAPPSAPQGVDPDSEVEFESVPSYSSESRPSAPGAGAAAPARKGLSSSARDGRQASSAWRSHSQRGKGTVSAPTSPALSPAKVRDDAAGASPRTGWR